MVGHVRSGSYVQEAQEEQAGAETGTAWFFGQGYEDEVW